MLLQKFLFHRGSRNASPAIKRGITVHLGVWISRSNESGERFTETPVSKRNPIFHNYSGPVGVQQGRWSGPIHFLKCKALGLVSCPNRATGRSKKKTTKNAYTASLCHVSIKTARGHKMRLVVEELHLRVESRDRSRACQHLLSAKKNGSERLLQSEHGWTREGKDGVRGDGQAPALSSWRKWKCWGQQREGSHLMKVVTPKHIERVAEA